MKAAPITSPVPPWRSPPETLVLGCDEVHVWRATLDQTPSQIQSFLHNLAADEQARAERFHFERDRGHFIVARGVLRAILGGYLKRAPEGLSFCYGSHGKPAIAGESGGDAIRFNVSHSHGIALYAVTRGREVGVDLERIRFNLAVAEIAERFFSRREVAMLRALPTEEQREAFFRCWTRKEACLKARGEGLSLPLDQVDVSLAPGEPDAAPGTQPDSSDASRWSLQELAPAPGYVAALAVEGHGWRLACWQWPDPGRQSV
ncbi:MAG: 4'-phosphopantetheinyl transferase superfamily protein [Verrucomicrobiota bacterium]|jgi:4'-phosphopantetheinyl transferase